MQWVALILWLVLSWDIGLAGAGDVAASDIGVVTQLKGDVRVLREQGHYELALGVDVRVGDIVTTGEGESSVQLEMKDGSLLAIGSRSKLYLSTYTLDHKQQVVDAEVSLIMGWLRFFTAKLQPDRTYQVVTPSLTAGIRGTEGVFLATSEITQFVLEDGQAILTEIDPNGVKTVLESLNSGYFAEQRNGQRLAIRKAIKESPFQDAFPLLMRQRLQRHLPDLKAHGIVPRYLHDWQRDDFALLLAHPQVFHRIKQQFHSNSRWRQKLLLFLKRHPDVKPLDFKQKMQQRSRHSLAE